MNTRVKRGAKLSTDDHLVVSWVLGRVNPWTDLVSPNE